MHLSVPNPKNPSFSVVTATMNMMFFKGLLQLAYTLFHISQPFRTLHDLAPEHPLAPVVIQPLERPTLLYSYKHYIE